MPPAVFPAQRAGQSGKRSRAGRLQPAGRPQGEAARHGRRRRRRAARSEQRYRWRKPLKVAVGTLAETARGRTERHARPQATPLAVPATIGGRIAASGGAAADDDYFRFESKAGQTWIVETDAARRGSPVDTVIEVLDGRRPADRARVLLQAVRDSNVTFRGIDGNTRDCRLTNWEEMQLNQLLYLNGEVVKLFRSPRGPDSGFLFYEGDGGKRLLLLRHQRPRCTPWTSPASSSSRMPPGAKLISTGLPVFPLYYTNDDDGAAPAGQRFAADVHRAGRRQLPGPRARCARRRRRPVSLSPDGPPAAARLQRSAERRRCRGAGRQRQAVHGLGRSHRRLRGRSAGRHHRPARRAFGSPRRW